MLNIRMESNEREALKRDAYSHMMTVSEYVRWLIAEQRKRDGKK